jgi:hypothetical protein
MESYSAAFTPELQLEGHLTQNGCMVPVPVQRNVGADGSLSGTMRLVSSANEHGCWQPVVHMQMPQQHVQPVVFVPVCCVSPSWSHDGRDPSATMTYSNFVAMQIPPVQPSQVYQDQQFQAATRTISGNSQYYNGAQTNNLFAGGPAGLQQNTTITEVHLQHTFGTGFGTPEVTSEPEREPVPIDIYSELTAQSSERITNMEQDEHPEQDQESVLDELSVDPTLDEDTCDGYSVLASSDASTAVSRCARRRRGRRAAKAKAASDARSTIPILESPANDEISVSEAMKKELTRQLEAGGASKRNALSRIHGSVLTMAFEPFGCRVVQLAFDVADAAEKQSFVEELRGHVRDAIASPHANFVIQKIIEVMPISNVTFVAEELQTFASEAARHRFACRVLCRLVEHHLCDEKCSKTTNVLIDELLHEAEKLIHHNFARHVIELILEHGSAKHQQRIALAIRGDIFGNSKSRYASYVVEQALFRCSKTEQDSIASELVGDTQSFVALAVHECGCHVVKAVLKTHGDVAKRAKALLLAGAGKIKASKYGQRLLEELC